MAPAKPQLPGTHPAGSSKSHSAASGRHWDSPGGSRGWGAFWGSWILANAAGELAGLGAAAAVGALLIYYLSDILSGALSYVLMVPPGALEGLAVGWLQWLVLRRRLTLPALSWIGATVWGSLIAWVAGVIPFALASAFTDTAPESGSEPPLLAFLLLAALIGLVAGPLLCVFQWRILARYVPRAGWWLAANAAAWLVAMPLIFLGAGILPADASLLLIASVAVASLLAGGAAAGAIHGRFLIWLLGRGPGPDAANKSAAA